MGMSWSRLSELSRCGAISTTFDFLQTGYPKRQRATNHRISPLAGVSSAINRP
jgi:hypothetical protein